MPQIVIVEKVTKEQWPVNVRSRFFWAGALLLGFPAGLLTAWALASGAADGTFALLIRAPGALLFAGVLTGVLGWLWRREGRMQSEKDEE